MTKHQQQIEELLAPLPENSAFLSTSGQAFVSPALDSGQTFPVASPYLCDWLIDHYHKKHGQFPDENALRQAVKILRSQAHARSQPRPVDVRIVGRDKTVYIDLANAAGDAVQVTPDGWRVTRPFDVAFRSSRGQLPLPQPTTNGQPPTTNAILDSEPIREWLLAALRPAGPYPILVLHGPPGSGKSTAARMLRALIDPVLAPVQPLPSRGREVLDLAARDRVLVFDHVTRMSESTADALCQIASGTAVTIKEPGDRNREPLRLDLARPVILTTPRCGLQDWQPRPDLANRILAVELPKIPNPRRAEDLKAEFEIARPALLATLYTALAASLTKQRDPAPARDERAALFDSSARHDPLFEQICSLTACHCAWKGTATDLSLTSPALPNPRALSHRLRQLQPALRSRGIQVEFHRTHGGVREIAIRGGESTASNHQPASNERAGADLRHPPIPPLTLTEAQCIEPFSSPSSPPPSLLPSSPPSEIPSNTHPTTPES